MNTKKPKGSGDGSKRISEGRFVPKSLAERLEHSPGLGDRTDTGCRITSQTSGRKLYWPVPVFTRLGIDTPASDSLRLVLDRLRKRCGISVVGNSLQQSLERSLDDGLSIAPIMVDEPCSLRTLMHAEQMELQFFRSRSGGGGGASEYYLADEWIPKMPSDLMQVEHLAKRVELYRSISDQPTVVVGACIAAGSIYHDVRYLIDSGLDYVCLLTDAVGGLMPARRWRFESIPWGIEEAKRAIADSGVEGFSLFLSGAIDQMEQPLDWIFDGVQAFSIDSVLASRSPAVVTSSASSDESFSSFLGGNTGYATPSAPSYDWLLDEADSWLTDWSSLRRFFMSR